MSEQVKNTSPSKPLIVYKGEKKPIPFRLWAAPYKPQNIEGYEFLVRAKISLEAKEVAFELDHSHFSIIDAENGLAYFVIPNEILDKLPSANYLFQITIKRPDGLIYKSSMFIISILESI